MSCVIESLIFFTKIKCILFVCLYNTREFVKKRYPLVLVATSWGPSSRSVGAQFIEDQLTGGQLSRGPVDIKLVSMMRWIVMLLNTNILSRGKSHWQYGAFFSYCKDKYSRVLL